MEKPTTAQDHRMLDYLDGKLEGDELSKIKNELKGSTTLQARLEELRTVHRVLAHTALESPSPTFVAKVMQNLNAVSFSGTLSPRNGLLLLAGVMVATGILVVMISAGVFDQLKGMISLEQASPIQKYFRPTLPSLSFNLKLIINCIIGLNLVLAFLVLDKTVLRPYFQRRSGAQL